MEECSSGVIGDATKEDAGCGVGKQRHREMIGQRMVLEASELSATQMYLVKELQSLTKPVLVVTRKKNRYQTSKKLHIYGKSGYNIEFYLSKERLRSKTVKKRIRILEYRFWR